MSKFLEYLNERTFRIGSDVDYIYKKIFHPYIKLLPDIDKFMNKVNKDKKNDFYYFGVVTSDELKTKDCKKAHEINPIDIKGGVFNNSAYIPGESLIKISLNTHLIALLQVQRTEKGIENIIGTSKMKQFFNEVSPASIKGTIYHELSH
jgi:hypothetical protein